MKFFLITLFISIIQELFFHFTIKWEINFNPDLFKDIILTDKEKIMLLKKRGVL